MAKWVRLFEASYSLDTSTSCIMVTACHHRNRYGKYPIWYKSDGAVGGRKSYVDIDYLINLRDKELEMHNESCDLFYFITEDMGIIQSKLAPILASGSEIFNKQKSWMSFMQTTLFGEPIKKFHSKTTRLQEFHRICSKLKEDYLCKKET